MRLCCDKNGFFLTPWSNEKKASPAEPHVSIKPLQTKPPRARKARVYRAATPPEMIIKAVKTLRKDIGVLQKCVEESPVGRDAARATQSLLPKLLKSIEKIEEAANMFDTD